MPIAGHARLAYEILVHNETSSPIHLTSLDASAVGIDPVHVAETALRARVRILADDDADQRANIATPLHPTAPGSDPLQLPPGRTAAVFLWLTLGDGNRVPHDIAHRIAYAVEREKRECSLRVPVSTVPPIVIGPPLVGGAWLPLLSPDDASPHRRTILRLHGQYRDAQRFAIDWGRVGPDGALIRPGTDPATNANTYGHGEPVIAVADAVVVAIHDGIPENGVGENSRAVPMTVQTVGGNYVILDLGQRRFAFYAHLQPGSIRVHVGDHAARGQTLALLGNSGNSSGPHLHFHVCDGPSPLECDGLPYVFDRFERQPSHAVGESASEARITATAPPQTLERVMVAPDSLVTFAAAPHP